MKTLVIRVVDSKCLGQSGLCSAVNEKEALTVLEHLSNVGLPVCLEYDDLPSGAKVPEHFNMLSFLDWYFKTRNL